MLSAHEGDGLELLERSVTDLASRLVPRDAALSTQDWIGREVGGYRLVSTLGEGGSSVVFLGEREQDGVRQQVAVKVLRRMLLGASEAVRFRRERRALAQLSHPGIAVYIDGGVTESGVAYIVLERVEGQTITEYARARRLSVARRVDLMVAVCRAVDAAHRALIVHRDLKPSNVLVTAAGQVKLLDFGIAKFLDTSEEATETQHRALTPAYAAPEQFTGGAVTTATDVYALGVILAELLTGQRPESRDTKAPSTRVGDDTTQAGLPEGGPAVRRQLRGDLDNVVLKAVSRDAAKRYPSAEALASDLERYLRSEPVQAHPPTWRYIAGKFVLRNRVATAAVAIAILGMSLGLTAALLQAQRAREEAARAQSTRDFLVSVFRSAEPAGPQARKPTVAEVTETAIKQIQVSTTLAPDVRDDLLIELGAVLRGQGELDEAESILRATLRDLAARRADPSLPARARLELSELLNAQDRPEQAEAELDALDGLDARTNPDLAARRLLLSASSASQQGDRSRALVAARAAVAACDTKCRPDTLLSATTELGWAASFVGEHETAIAVLRDAEQMAHRVHGVEHVQTAEVLLALGAALRRAGRHRDARPILERALEIGDKALPQWHWRRASYLNQLGVLLFDLDEIREARDLFTRSISIDSSASLQTIRNLLNLAIISRRLGDYEDSMRTAQSALDSTTAMLGHESPQVGQIRCILGYALAMAGRLVEGREHCLAGVQRLEQEGASWSSERIVARSALAAIETWLGNHDAALKGYDDLIEAASAIPAYPERTLLTHRIRRANTLLLAGRRRAYLEAVSEVEALIERTAPANLARSEYALGRAQSALSAGDRAEATLWLADVRRFADPTNVHPPYTATWIAKLQREIDVGREVESTE